MLTHFCICDHLKTFCSIFRDLSDIPLNVESLDDQSNYFSTSLHHSNIESTVSSTPKCLPR